MHGTDAINLAFRKKSRGTIQRAKSPFVYFVVMLPLFALLVTSSHYHADLTKRLDCALCKSAQDLSSGDSQGVVSFDPQRCEETAFIAEPVQCGQNILASVMDCRAPPSWQNSTAG